MFFVGYQEKMESIWLDVSCGLLVEVESGLDHWRAEQLVLDWFSHSGHQLQIMFDSIARRRDHNAEMRYRLSVDSEKHSRPSVHCSCGKFSEKNGNVRCSSRQRARLDALLVEAFISSRSLQYSPIELEPLLSIILHIRKVSISIQIDSDHGPRDCHFSPRLGITGKTHFPTSSTNGFTVCSVRPEEHLLDLDRKWFPYAVLQGWNGNFSHSEYWCQSFDLLNVISKKEAN